ncbi:hypothetical protein [Chamaesiphon sp.]|uniref:hypothetical protein n=1 Tax=Chamaesiphon sp. TaxID=2814140 RepID=UPI003592E998
MIIIWLSESVLGRFGYNEVKLLEQAIAKLKTRPISDRDRISIEPTRLYAIENLVKIFTDSQR